MKRIKVLGILLISTMSVFGQNTYKKGILPGKDKLYNQLPQKAKLTRAFYTNFPVKYSLKKYSPTPGFQGNYGTCTAWAAAYTARTIIEARNNNYIGHNLINDNVFSPGFQYRITESNEKCDGSYTSEVVLGMVKYGSVFQKDFEIISTDNYMCPSNYMPKSNLDKAQLNKIDGYATLWEEDIQGYNQNKVILTKKSISESNPVVISMICPDSFDKIGSDGLWHPTENPNDVDSYGRKHARHAVCVIGFDDTKFGGAFEIENSWGTRWGNKGYAWIRYNDFDKFVYQGYEIIKLGKPTPRSSVFSGSLKLFDLDDNRNLPVMLASLSRNWNVAKTEKEVEVSEADYTYKVIPALLSGTKMRMYLSSEEPAYVYILGTGTTNRSVSTLFPSYGISPLLNYSESEIALPSEDLHFEMDSTPGKDYLVVIFSKEEINVEELRTKLEVGNKNVSKALKNSLGALLINHKDIDFSDNEIKFVVKQNNDNKKLFAMIIEFTHK